MASEIKFDAGPGLTGITAYAMLRNATGQVYNTAGSAFENYNAANITDYDIALTEQGAIGFFLGDMPAVAAGLYAVTIKQRAGGSPAVSDTRIGGGDILWTGSVVNGSTGREEVNVEQIKTNPVVNGGTVTFPTNATLASTTNITAGTITTTTNLTNPPPDSSGTSILLGISYAGGGTVVDAAATTTSFKTNLTAVDNFFNDALLVFTSGALDGEARPIKTYANTNGVITFDEALTSAPANGVTFYIRADHIHPVSQIATAIWQDTTAGDFTVASSIGKSLYTSGNVPGAASGLSLVGSAMTISGTTTTFDALQTALNSAHGAGSWATATGFSTHTAADVWSVATRILTAATNITSTGGTTVPQTGDSFARIGLAGASLSAIPWNASWNTQVQTDVVAALNQALTESYRTAGSTASVAQMLYELIAHLGDSAIAGTTKTLKKIDGSTAKTYTLDSATTPTSITEAT